MHIGRLRVSWHADRPDPPLAAQAKPQHHDQRQRQTVAAQLHRLPAVRLIPDLPAIGVAAQPTKCRWMAEQNVPWQHPKTVQRAPESREQTGPHGNRQEKQRAQGERLGQQIRRQQVP